MHDSIWVVLNGIRLSRKEELAPELYEAESLTLQHCFDEADILTKVAYDQVTKLSRGDRIVIRQGNGEYIACGRVREEARELMNQDKDEFSFLYRLTQAYNTPQQPGNELVGIIFYVLRKATKPLLSDTNTASDMTIPFPFANYILSPNLSLQQTPDDKIIELKSFNNLLLDSPYSAYAFLDRWWHRVVKENVTFSGEQKFHL